MIFESILVIARPKKNGWGSHFGVQFSTAEVYDYTSEAGFRRVSRAEFADGEAVSVVRTIPWHQRHVVRARLYELMRNPLKYDLLQWNCETFAEWLTSGVARSAQVAGVLIAVGLVVAIALLART